MQGNRLIELNMSGIESRHFLSKIRMEKTIQRLNLLPDLFDDAPLVGIGDRIGFIVQTSEKTRKKHKDLDDPWTPVERKRDLVLLNQILRVTSTSRMGWENGLLMRYDSVWLEGFADQSRWNNGLALLQPLHRFDSRGSTDRLPRLMNWVCLALLFEKKGTIVDIAELQRTIDADLCLVPEEFPMKNLLDACLQGVDLHFQSCISLSGITNHLRAHQ